MDIYVYNIVSSRREAAAFLSIGISTADRSLGEAIHIWRCQDMDTLSTFLLLIHGPPVASLHKESVIWNFEVLFVVKQRCSRVGGDSHVTSLYDMSHKMRTEFVVVCMVVVMLPVVSGPMPYSFIFPRGAWKYPWTMWVKPISNKPWQNTTKRKPIA